MSEQPPGGFEEVDDLELQALQRELDDAFATTRPRQGFDDELWLHIQQSRPAPNRLADALAGLWRGITVVPVVPAAAVATFLVVLIGVGLFAYSGLGSMHGASTGSNGASLSEPNSARLVGNFGRLPSPVFSLGQKSGGALSPTGAADYAGPAQLTWTGHLDLTITVAPVFRYQEPSTIIADQFASGLGAVLHGRPSGFLGEYTTSDYTLKVRGTVQSPPSSPAYFIFSNLKMPSVEAAGAGQADIATVFLAEHSLVPEWNYTVAVDDSGDPIKVVYQRQFTVPGNGPTYLVDGNGLRFGLEVDLSNNRPVLASGMLPVSMDSANYPIVSADQAIRSALSTSQPVPVTSTPAPAVQLTQAELVYVLVPAGDHSFFEPAFLFSGTFKVNGQTLTKRVLVAAVDPSQRTS